MALATFKLRGKSVPVVIEKVRDIISKLTANILVYATPVPTTIVLTAAVDKLEDAYQAAINGGKDKKAQMRIYLEELLVLMSTLQGYVQSTSAGDSLKILLVADVKKERSPIGILPPPANVRGTYRNHEGEIIFRWAGVPSRTQYLMQLNPTPADDSKWEELGLTGKVRAVTDKLTSGQTYGFRVAAISSAGIGGWSDVAIQKAR